MCQIGMKANMQDCHDRTKLVCMYTISIILTRRKDKLADMTFKQCRVHKVNPVQTAAEPDFSLPLMPT